MNYTLLIHKLNRITDINRIKRREKCTSSASVMSAENTITFNSFQETDIFKTSKSDYTEYEANLFAAELLLEDHEVWEELMLSGLTYPQIAMKLGVPVSLMEFKLVMLKSKGYIMTDLPTTKNDFLKYESYAYDDWYAD